MFKTTPFAHQLAELNEHGDEPARGIFWDMGTGKTKVTIDTAARLWRAGKIDGLLVLAPNGVHQNWVLDEIPAHLPDDVPRLAHSYATVSASSKWHRAAIASLIEHRDGLAILAMSYNAFRTAEGRRAAERFLAARRTLYVLDESQRIKSPSAKRTISVVATGRRAEYKRILSGTPVTNKPFDVYSQVKFLDEGYWARAGFASYEAFKTTFGVWVEREAMAPSGKLGRFSQVVGFKDINRLADLVGAISSRVMKEDVLDLPPKTYTKRYFELCPEQAKAYAEIRDEFLTLLASGETVTVPLMVTRFLRLQQVTCGFVVADDGTLTRFPDNPRLAALREVLEDAEGSAIVFARFREDVDRICEALGPGAVRYDGAVGEEGRLEARRRFQDGSARYFVGNPAVAGTGLTLTRASTVVYYSNSFNLEERLQSEDRAHRIGQARSVTYVDLVAEGTIDRHVLRNLRDKVDLAAAVNRDRAREWLTP